MSFWAMIPDEITMFYLFITSIILLIVPLPLGNIPLIIGLIISLLPLMKKILYPEITIAFDKIGNTERIELIPTRKIKKKGEEFVDYNGVIKEYPTVENNYFIKKGINTLFNNIARFVYKDDQRIQNLSRADIDETHATFLSKSEKEEELRSMKRREEEMRSKKDYTTLIQFANTLLLIIASVTIIYGVGKNIEIATGVKTVITQIPDDMIDQGKDVLLDLVDNGVIQIIVQGNETMNDLKGDIIDNPII